MANRGINKVILVGNLGAEPDVRYLPGGGMVTTLRLATGEVWKDQAGQPQERTEWHRVVFYRRLAEVAAEYLKKGCKIYIEGSLRTQQWDKDGEKRYTTEVLVKELQMLDRFHETSEATSPPSKSKPANTKTQHAPSSTSNSAQAAQQAPTHSNYFQDNFEEELDDIPF